jgi:hypothetical protein
MPARAAQDSGQRAGSIAAAEWARLQVTAPQVVLTIHRYLRQLGTFLAPRSVTAAEGALRQFARWLVTEAQITAVANIRRDDIGYKVWLVSGTGRLPVINRETPAADAPVASSSSRSSVGLTGRAAAQSGHRRGHPQSPSRCRSSSTTATRRADGRGPGQR